MSKQPCKRCGHCPTCGRGGYRFYPHWQWIPPTYPYWGTGDHWYPTTIGNDSTSPFQNISVTYSGNTASATT